MRDLHFDGEFLRDFNNASKNWSWATWHKVRSEQEQIAQRLLEQVFGNSDEKQPPENPAQGEK